MEHQINWDLTREELDLTLAIAQRAHKLNPELDVLHTQMDLAACHLNGMPLRLKDMMEWDRDFDIMHDVYGIRNCINRDTGRLKDSSSRGSPNFH